MHGIGPTRLGLPAVGRAGTKKGPNRSPLQPRRRSQNLLRCALSLHPCPRLRSQHLLFHPADQGFAFRLWEGKEFILQVDTYTISHMPALSEEEKKRLVLLKRQMLYRLSYGLANRNILASHRFFDQAAH